MRKKDTCVIALINFYDIKSKNAIKVYRVISCVLYSIIKIYVCIDYLCFQSKILSRISSDRIFKQTSYNILLGIVIPEVLMNLVYCHVFMEKSNSTVILNCRSCLVNNYLEKSFLIIANNSKHLSIFPNDVKLRIHAIYQIETYFVMAKKHRNFLSSKHQK